MNAGAVAQRDREARMKVLFVLPRMYAGGVERVTLHLAESFQQHGIACSLALRKCEGELLDEARGCMDVHELARAGLWMFVPNLVRLIRSWRPTHLVTALSDVGLLALIALRLSGHRARIVHGIHNTHDWMDHLAGQKKFGRGSGALEKYLYRRVDALVCVSQGIKDEVQAMAPSVMPRTHLIHNPVDTTIPAHGDPGHVRTLQAPMSRMLSLGRLTAEKGIDVLIEAAALLPWDLDWSLDIYGEGPLRTALQNQIDEAGLERRVVLRGHTNQPLEVMRESHIFVLPSRREGFGMVLVEAMSQGLQVVAADCRHGPGEILEAGRYGLLVPPEQPRRLCEALEKVLRGGFHVPVAELQERARAFGIEASSRSWRTLLASLEE